MNSTPTKSRRTLLAGLMFAACSSARADTAVKVNLTTPALIAAVRSDSLNIAGVTLEGALTAGGLSCGTATEGKLKPSACPGLGSLVSSVVTLNDAKGHVVALALSPTDATALGGDVSLDQGARTLTLPAASPAKGNDLLLLVNGKPPAVAKRDPTAPTTFNLESVGGVAPTLLAGCSSAAPCALAVRVPDGATEYGWSAPDYTGGQAKVIPQPENNKPDGDDAMTTDCDAEVRAQNALGVYAVCYDIRSGGVKQADNISNQIILPNRSLRVIVLHLGTQKVGITVTGQRGTFEPGSDVPSTAGSRGEGSVGTAERTSLEFGPRKPGTSVDVNISVGGTALVSTELEVATTYAGAVRLGVAAGTVVDASYEAITTPGSTQSEIVQTSGADQMLEPELVVAYAPFWFQPKGRSYLGETPALSADRFAPFLGLGVASLSSSSTVKFSLLHSVYLGAEYEFGRHSSIFVAAQARAVDRLPAGFEVGGPLSGSEVPTVRDWPIGFAFGYTFSPDFLKVAQPLASE